ncbi:MAG: hypothetical protein QOE44_2207, partial [Solirubrobacteraceae bacterium]|nr:hypothetical protein [Solirubrobacteraceae bacterium]
MTPPEIAASPAPAGESRVQAGAPGPAPEAARARAAARSLAAYAKPNVGRAALDVATSIVAYVGLCAAMYLVLDVSYLLVLALAIPAAGFAVRTFIVFHDCGHGSFLPSKRWNAWVGGLAGLVIYMPFRWWRHDHAVHHATAGDLDRRGVGDVQTLTVAEYEELSPARRLAYRLFRNPFVMFGLGPIMTLFITPRIPSRGDRPRIRRSVMATNLGVVALIGGICWAAGWRSFLLVQVPVFLIGGSVG